MTKSSKIRQGRQCIFNINVHLVFITKQQGKIFDSAILEDIEKLISKICDDAAAQLLKFHGGDDYIHILINYPPKISVSKLVGSLKGSTSYVLKTLHPELKDKYFNGALWSPSYLAVSSAEVSQNIIDNYLKNTRS